MNREMVWKLALAAVATLAVLAAVAVWVTEELRLIGVVVMALGAFAAGLVEYFDWRTKLRRRVSDREPRHAA